MAAVAQAAEARSTRAPSPGEDMLLAATPSTYALYALYVFSVRVYVLYSLCARVDRCIVYRSCMAGMLLSYIIHMVRVKLRQKATFNIAVLSAQLWSLID